MSNLTPRFQQTYCSQCGKELGPGDEGVSRCYDHTKVTAQPAEGNAKDTDRLDWLGRQDLNDTDLGFVHDAPHDGEVSIGIGYATYYGKTLRDAIDAAIASKGTQP
jgi:hypothetical protein